MTIDQAAMKDIDQLVSLGLLLWPEHTPEDLNQEFSGLLSRKECAFFLLKDQYNTAVGFAQCQLRHDYVEGTDSTPVGYLKGVFVAEAYRRQGNARLLLSACEAWAKSMGCTEFASDCPINNDTSLAFHLGAGFTEANRIICFTKTL